MGHKLFILPPTERYIILGIILLIWLLVRGSQLFLFRNKNHPLPGSPREYGIAGGTICPKCHRPFPLSLFMLKLGLGTRFTRCPYCGKWSFVQRRSLPELRAAEAVELADAQPAPLIREKSEAEKAQAYLDDSRFTDKP